MQWIEPIHLGYENSLVQQNGRKTICFKTFFFLVDDGRAGGFKELTFWTQFKMGRVQHSVISLYQSVQHSVISLYQSVQHIVISLYQSVQHIVISLYQSVQHNVILLYQSVQHNVILLYQSVQHNVISLYQSVQHSVISLYRSVQHVSFHYISQWNSWCPTWQTSPKWQRLLTNYKCLNKAAVTIHHTELDIILCKQSTVH
jgi:hypothetical protein